MSDTLQIFFNALGTFLILLGAFMQVFYEAERPKWIAKVPVRPRAFARHWWKVTG